MSSLSTASKAGIAGIVGSSGLVAGGLEINNQIQKSKEGSEAVYKLQNLDRDFIKETGASFVQDNSFDVNPNNNQEIFITVESYSQQSNSLFGKTNNQENIWKCVITGFLDAGIHADWSNPDFFAKESWRGEIRRKLQDPKNKEGFIKSCSRNRTEKHSQSEGKLTSEIRVKLKYQITYNYYGDKKSWVFTQEDLDSIWSGDWDNNESNR